MRSQVLISTGMALLLAGCASPGEMRAAGPIAELTSTKAPKAVAECMHAAWGEVTIGGVPIASYIAPRGDGFTVTSSGSPATEMADITAREQGSAVSIYQQKGIAKWRGERFVSATKTCL